MLHYCIIDSDIVKSLFLTQTPTPSSIVLTQPDPTSTTDIETVSFKFPWEISSEQSTPSIFLTTTPAHRSMNDPFVSSEPTHGPVSVSSPSPTSSSHSLSVRAVTGITVGAVLATVFIAAILVMYLHKKNEKRKGAARASRAQAREEVHVDLSPGA